MLHVHPDACKRMIGACEQLGRVRTSDAEGGERCVHCKPWREVRPVKPVRVRIASASDDQRLEISRILEDFRKRLSESWVRVMYSGRVRLRGKDLIAHTSELQVFKLGLHDVRPNGFERITMI